MTTATFMHHLIKESPFYTFFRGKKVLALLGYIFDKDIKEGLVATKKQVDELY